MLDLLFQQCSVPDRRSEKLSELLSLQSTEQTGTGGSPVVVHRDAMVLTMTTTRQQELDHTGDR